MFQLCVNVYVSAAHRIFPYFAFRADKVNSEHFLVIPFLPGITSRVTLLTVH